MVRAGAMECFQDSCISACMIRRELCGRGREIWPWASAVAVVAVVAAGDEDDAFFRF